MDFSREQTNNQPSIEGLGMSPKLCPRGAELFAVASHADDAFKTKLVQFFSNSCRDDQEMLQIEVLGAQHREADEVFQRHKRFCAVCAETHVSSRYVAAD